MPNQDSHDTDAGSPRRSPTDKAKGKRKAVYASKSDGEAASEQEVEDACMSGSGKSDSKRMIDESGAGPSHVHGEWVPGDAERTRGMCVLLFQSEFPSS